MTTRYIPITPLNFHSEIRVDTQGDEVSVSVYNCDIHHIDLLIMQLEALKAETALEAYKANPITWPHDKLFPQNLGAASLIDADEPPQMTAVLGKKPESTDWYKNALQKVAAQPIPKTVNAPVTTEPLPPMPQRKRDKNIINVMSIKSKSHVRCGHTYEGTMNPYENADIVKNSWIRIYGLKQDQTRWDATTMRHVRYSTAYDRTFKMGDQVEYDSYNFAYIGTIVAIGEKTIKIEHSHGGKITQLDLHTFTSRNWDLDLAKIAEDRANWYD